MSDSAIPIPGYRIDECISTGSASTLYRGRRELDGTPVVLQAMNADVLEGTLAYMSPEQTGRMNRMLDYRSDFYSLGVTLYELFTGRLPFPAEDPLKLVHSHIARRPEPPSDARPNIPEPLSNLILKLMAKTAEERYQSAWGIRADLEQCLGQWRRRRRIDRFPLGSRDIPDNFQVSQRLYGRDREITPLLASFERIAAPTSADNPARELTLVAGYSGIGKSALVSEQPLAQTWGHLLPVLQEGLVLPVSEPALSDGDPGRATLAVHEMRFPHDRVQQAAYALTPEAETASGEEAITALENAELPYRLVLMDWKMPGIDGITAARRIRTDRKLSTIPAVLMVTAYGREELMTQAENAGIEAFLVKPVSPSTLLDSVLTAFGHEPERMAAGPGRIATAAQLRGARLLLVEDNDINRQVAIEVLGQAGIEVTVAENGHIGVDTLSARPNAFDDVLMDIQMPVMDGYEASRAIRQDPRFRDLPVIAITANAMTGDREKAIAAGMNDHLAKPIDVKELFEVLGHWIQVSEERRRSAPVPQPVSPPADEPVPGIAGIDTAAGERRTGGNRKLYRQLLLRFRDSQGDFDSLFRAAQADEDPQAPTRCAHTLKGVAGNIGAVEVQEAAKELETASREGMPAGEIDARLARVLDALSPVIAALSDLDCPATAAGDGNRDRDGEPDPDALRTLLVKLRGLLEDADAEATEVVEELEPLLRNSIQGQSLGRLVGQIAGFDFEAALETLRDIEERQV